MNYGFKNHIRVFFMADNEQSIFKDLAKGVLWKVIDSPLWEFGRKLVLSKEDNVLIEKVEKEVNKAKWTPIYTILKETGMISDDKASLAERWRTSRGDSNDGREWAKKLLQALEDYRVWKLTILTYSSKEWYKNEDLKTYESKVRTDINFMNVNLMKGFYWLRWTKMWFEDTTWNQIGLYVLSRGWTSNLVSWWNQSDINTVIELWKKEKEAKEAKLKVVLESSLKDPKIRSFLEKEQILINDKFDITKELDKLKAEKKSIAEVEAHFNWLADKFLKEARVFLEKSREIARQTALDKKTLAQLNIPWITSKSKDGKTVDVSSKLLTDLNLEECKDAIIGVDTWFNKLDKNSPDYKEKQELVTNIKKVLIALREGYNNSINASQTKRTADKAAKNKKDGITAEEFKLDDQKTLDAVGNIWVARFKQESTKEKLLSLWISTLEQAEKKIDILKRKTILTPDEEYEKKLLEEFIRDNIAVARELQITERVLWVNQARELFTQTNRFISQDPGEKYNFDHLEQIATRTDPESTPGEVRFARLKIGESISIEEFVERRRWDDPVYSIPEFSGSQIIKNADDTYSIKGLLNVEKPLTRDELREYIKTIRIYADVWLGQFIPHINLIGAELRKQWMNIRIDWKTDTMEQQNILKALYKMLFWEEILSSNFEEVNKKFSKKVGGPENMRYKMQGALRTHKLIGETDYQPIGNSRLQLWFDELRKDDQPTPEVT